jgi:hypothetical protein
MIRADSSFNRSYLCVSAPRQLLLRCSTSCIPAVVCESISLLRCVDTHKYKHEVEWMKLQILAKRRFCSPSESLTHSKVTS